MSVNRIRSTQLPIRHYTVKRGDRTDRAAVSNILARAALAERYGHAEKAEELLDQALVMACAC